MRSARDLLPAYARMDDRDEFGPTLRSEREKRRITLEEIAAATKVSVELWDGLERNDFSRWPAGIFARAFVRDYARAVGLDADAVVDDFCRLFPIGDRRAARIIHAQAELIGHVPEGIEASEPLPAGRERRRAPRDAQPSASLRTVYAPRLFAASVDVLCVTGLAFGGAALFRASFWASAGVAAVLYYAASTVSLGATPGMRAMALLNSSVGPWVRGSIRPRVPRSAGL